MANLQRKYAELHVHPWDEQFQTVAAAANLLALQNAALYGRDAEEAKVRIIPRGGLHMP